MVQHRRVESEIWLPISEKEEENKLNVAHDFFPFIFPPEKGEPPKENQPAGTQD